MDAGCVPRLMCILTGARIIWRLGQCPTLNTTPRLRAEVSWVTWKWSLELSRGYVIAFRIIWQKLLKRNKESNKFGLCNVLFGISVNCFSLCRTVLQYDRKFSTMSVYFMYTCYVYPKSYSKYPISEAWVEHRNWMRSYAFMTINTVCYFNSSKHNKEST